jgi:hypothetical protein
MESEVRHVTLGLISGSHVERVRETVKTKRRDKSLSLRSLVAREDFKKPSKHRAFTP